MSFRQWGMLLIYLYRPGKTETSQENIIHRMLNEERIKFQVNYGACHEKCERLYYCSKIDVDHPSTSTIQMSTNKQQPVSDLNLFFFSLSPPSTSVPINYFKK